MRKTQHQILYTEDSAENLVLACGKHGIGYAGIHRLLAERGLPDLTDAQIAIRLTKAKLWEQQQQPYIGSYRNGTSPEIQRLLDDRIAVTQAEIARTLPKRIVHPTPDILEYVDEHKYRVPKERQKWQRQRSQYSRREYRQMLLQNRTNRMPQKVAA